ncbi:P-loop containing nucleoside triphosphate hydrolase protein [Coprinopsis marcescibilis]|uniref:DNA 3'-5' helicase n=1 Tax=Coprinopsis marcescibilis TaxID=230819 RepID=A0A5C3KEC2_COPMA|nr:P-loop containing nucleoside triphosphate hydrolase protein [Coprinopsis marcescibilis]
MSVSTTEWTFEKIRALGLRVFKRRLCYPQLQIIQNIQKGLDVIACLPTGAGKTLTFWMPVLMAIEEGSKDAMTFVITPLNLLGKQNEQQLKAANISAISISAANVSDVVLKDVASGVYNVIIVNPEILMSHPGFDKLLSDPKFTSRIQNITFDEGHCISQWGKFRKDYRQVGSLRFKIPESIPFYVATATLPHDILSDIKMTLRFRRDKTVCIRRSNDRPDIQLMVRPLVYPINSFKDLDFLLDFFPKDWKPGDQAPPKFLIFFDDTKEAERACRYLSARLADRFKDKVAYFHSTMSDVYRDDHYRLFFNSLVIGMFCTDAFGMGMDIPDIDFVIQWRAPRDMCTLWQRFGRVARGKDRTGVAIFLVDKKDTDEARHLKEQKLNEKKKKDVKAGAKRKAAEHDHSSSPSKRAALADRTINTNNQPNNPQPPCIDESDAVLIAEHTEMYRRQGLDNPQNKPIRGQSRTVQLGSALDDFINSKTRNECRRKWPNVYFLNNDAHQNDRFLCDSQGCARCKLLQPTVCCDVCHPGEFTQYSVEFVKTPKATARSSVKTLPMDDHAKDLKRALYVWRKDIALKIHSPGIIRAHGNKIVMTEDILNRIIDCARAKKLPSVEALKLETSWRYAEEHGASLLAIVGRFYPPESAVEEGKGRKRAQGRCSQCDQVGHISELQPQLSQTRSGSG